MAERNQLASELSVVAGRIDSNTDDLVVLFVDPSATRTLYGGDESWARCVKGYLNGRGYGASIAIAPTKELALRVARARWGITVVRDDAGSAASRDPRESTSVRIKAVQGAARPDAAPAELRSKPVGHGPASPQLGLPGLKLGRAKHRSRPSASRPESKGPPRAA